MKGDDAAMTLTRKDLAATCLTLLVVATFAATHRNWNVWLVGESHRWAAVVILTLGVATCAFGSPEPGRSTRVLSVLGVLAVVLGVSALVTGSLTLLSLLVVDIVVLWAASTVGHALHPPARRSSRNGAVSPDVGGA
jgi:hypothetical protein